VHQGLACGDILALVRNVDPLLFPGLPWEGTDAGPVIVEATAQLGEPAVWHSIRNYPPSATPHEYQGSGLLISCAWLQDPGLPTDGSAGFKVPAWSGTRGQIRRGSPRPRIGTGWLEGSMW